MPKRYEVTPQLLPFRRRPAKVRGCANLQNISANDLRKPEYASKLVHTDKTIPKIRETLFSSM